MQTQPTIQKEVSQAGAQTHHLKVGDAVWIATALLHRENPARDETGFTVDEVVERVLRGQLTDGQRISVYLHANQHCVANRKPNPGRMRMLYELENGNRRLYRKGDYYDPAREGARITPQESDVPGEYISLLTWYTEWEKRSNTKTGRFKALFDLFGSGKEIWADEHADEYVNRLRKDWE